MRVWIPRKYLPLILLEIVRYVRKYCVIVKVDYVGFVHNKKLFLIYADY